VTFQRIIEIGSLKEIGSLQEIGSLKDMWSLNTGVIDMKCTVKGN
jgi:hypothetical protein